MEKVLLRPEEAAEMLSIGRSAVYEAMRSGALESLRIGRSRRVPVDAIRRFLEHLRHGDDGTPEGPLPSSPGTRHAAQDRPG